MKKELVSIKKLILRLDKELGELDEETRDALGKEISSVDAFQETLETWGDRIGKMANKIILDPPAGTSFSEARCPELLKMIPMTGWQLKTVTASNDLQYFEKDGELLSVEEALKWFEENIPLYRFLIMDGYDKNGILELAKKLGVKMYKEDYSFSELFDYDELFVNCSRIETLNRINREIEDYFMFHLMSTDAVRWAKKEISIKELMKMY